MKKTCALVWFIAPTFLAQAGGIIAPQHKPLLLVTGNHVSIEVEKSKSFFEKFNPASRGKTIRIDGKILTTTQNNVGIDPKDTCGIFFYENKTFIVCSSGKQFDNPGQTESSITGTPGNLMYENYIGFVKTEAATSGLMGSGKRIDYCDGACKRKNK